jgi:dynactin complex subunit
MLAIAKQNQPKLLDETVTSLKKRLKDKNNKMKESNPMINEISVIRWSPY